MASLRVPSPSLRRRRRRTKDGYTDSFHGTCNTVPLIAQRGFCREPTTSEPPVRIVSGTCHTRGPALFLFSLSARGRRAIPPYYSGSVCQIVNTAKVAGVKTSMVQTVWGRDEPA